MRWTSDGIEVEQLEMRGIVPIRHCTVCGKPTKKYNHKSKCRSKEAQKTKRITKLIDRYVKDCISD